MPAQITLFIASSYFVLLLTQIPLNKDALNVWIRTQTLFLNVLLGKQNLFIFLYGLTNSIHAILVTTTVSMNKLWELLQRV